MVFTCRLKQFFLFKLWVWDSLLTLAGVIAWIAFGSWIYFVVALVIGALPLLAFLNTVILPPRIEIHDDAVKLMTFKFFGLAVDVQTVPYSKVAMVKKQEGLIFSGIEIETSGGDQDMLFQEMKRSDARKAFELIQSHRTKSEAGRPSHFE